SADARLNEEQLIAYMEGDLTIEEIELVDRTMVLYPENKVVLNEFLQTKLSAENFVFDNKEKLKKPIAKRIPLYLNITSVAATLLMIGLLGYLIKQKPKSQSQAHIEPVLVQPELKNVTNIKPIIPNKELPNLKSQPAKIEAINRESVLLVALESRPVNLMTKFNSELELPEIQLPIPQQSSYKLSIVKSEKPFLKPGDFVVQKFKDELLSQVGVSFHQETNEETQVRRYGLISKYFAYERIEKTN
ncbi:MAG: hypothetical protein MH472_12420, partial [Bacteroidia bacterium]|nr:hypothetical protein [Bacteroidia bacterium]